MAEYSANAVQTIPAGGSAVFTTTVIPCNMGFVMHMDGTPGFELSGWVPNNGCCYCARRDAMYEAFVGGNIAVSTGGTAEEQISLAIAVNGTALPYSEMDVTPAAVEEFFHVSNQVTVPILRGCCQTVTVVNLSAQSIDVKNLVLKLKRTDLN